VHIQTILTGEHRHTNDTTNGQRVSRHSLPTLLCFNFFPTAQNILKFSSRTNGTFGFAQHTSRPFAKPKEPLFSNTFNDDLKEVKNFFQENIVT